MKLVKEFRIDLTCDDNGARPLLEHVGVQPFYFSQEDRDLLANRTSGATRYAFGEVNAVAMAADGFCLAVVPCVLQDKDVGPTDGRPFVALHKRSLQLVRRFQRGREVLEFTLAEDRVILDEFTTIRRFEAEKSVLSGFPDMVGVAADAMEKIVLGVDAATSKTIDATRQRKMVLDTDLLTRIVRAMATSGTSTKLHMGHQHTPLLLRPSGTEALSRVRYHSVLKKEERTGVVPLPPFGIVMPMMETGKEAPDAVSSLTEDVLRNLQKDAVSTPEIVHQPMSPPVGSHAT